MAEGPKMEGARATGNGGGMLNHVHLSENLEAAREQLGDVGKNIARFVRERPGASIAIAVGAGFLVGRLLKR